MERDIEKVLDKHLMGFVYKSEELRLEHIKALEERGWEVGSKVKRLKRGLSVWDSQEESNYEWFAEFWKYNI